MRVLLRPLWLIALTACGDDLAGAARDETLTFTVQGVERSVILHVPAGRRDGSLVLGLHASGSTAAGHQVASQLDALADRAGFAVAYPQGAIGVGGGFQWHVPGQPLVGGEPEPAGPDDVVFLAQVIAVIDHRIGIDRHRLYATGFSGGARMISQLACDLPELAAIAPISGVRFSPPCARNDMAVIAFHGTADGNNPYAGHGNPYWTYGVAEAMNGWATQAGCALPPTVSRPGPTVELSTFGACARGAAVQLYALEGEGHELPRALDANLLMWDFFRAHPRR
jgi:polyhydroxybutyrate depolymerase